MTYRGFDADSSVDEEDALFFGFLNDVPDSVSFHSETYATLRAAMIEAVEDYIDYVATEEEVAARFIEAGLRIDPLTGHLVRQAEVA